ncbi:gamma subclass chorismate mutase AroQ [Actinoplanes sp. LDG1-06]|uniref:chorismate mutase n=1 Tax=Paractinoplanes ovalisporus TaxID=2810368 RepID=A0ABS2AKU1_9ACTN|nr:gamma subclass chorismate mutase AroQ [Actinoplanes ovalisporus]MBM2620460.1 gamma subclass chorismate mutase AroQ [Actinoplanes ovalisporus]
MFNNSRVFRTVLAGLMMTGTLTSSATAAAAHPAEHPPGVGLTALVGLSAERILLADKVAAAKFGTTTPIVDPVREQQVLDQAAALAVQAGLDTTDTVTFFRAQIEMSKVVQQGLFDRWTAHPEQAPTERPDLATEVRPELDRITSAFIAQLAATAKLRATERRCHLERAVAVRIAARLYDLDQLHGQALRGAAEPVCPRHL